MIASGLLAIGSGLGAVLVAPVAGAAGKTRFLLKLYKRVSGAKKLVATLPLPEELVEKLAQAGDGQLKLVFERVSSGQSQALGEKEIPEAARLKTAAKNRKK